MFRHLLAVVVGLTWTATYAADWPQWRGPNRDGISSETGLLHEWPQDEAAAGVARQGDWRRILDAGRRRRSTVLDQ